jgi:hypothetical protein
MYANDEGKIKSHDLDQNNTRKVVLMANKVDFKKALKQLYNPSTKAIHMVEVPGMNFLMVDGKGDPNTSPDYQRAIDALYSLAYGVKFALKPQGYDHIVPPLEGLWWVNDTIEFTVANKQHWEWTMMIMQPEWVLPEYIEQVREMTSRKKSNELLTKIRFEYYNEGLAFQVLYIGAYKDEAPVIASLHKHISVTGYKLNGKHHEIYVGDPRKTSPERLRTILRQPVCK